MNAPEVVLGITGSIAAYKAADVVRRLREQGCGVTCVMTKEAEQFVTPLTLQALSERPVQTDLFSLVDPHIVHTRLAETANLILIAPATANVLGKLAHGLADDVLTCLVMASKAPVLIAPAMNVHMYHHATTQESIRLLKRLGVRFIGPQVGSLACGYEALGHLAEVEEIVQMAVSLLKKPLAAAHTSAPRPPSKPSAKRKPTAVRRRR
jgi:phosphopantothenoylcysteine synthetase/decarboxylase